MFEEFKLNKAKLKKPNSNESINTLQEIKSIISMKGTGDKNTDKRFVLYYDDIEKAFKDIFKKNNISFPEKLYENLINSSAKKILKLKNYFNRDRPREVAKNYGLDLEVVNMQSAKTKSYPSGHSAQAVLIANVFSEIYPNLRKQFTVAADNISKSRLIAKVHYPSDSRFGEELGLAMYNYLKNKNNA